MTDPQAKPSVPRKRLSAVLYLLLLVALCFGAYQARQLVFRPQPPAVNADTWAAPEGPDEPASRPFDAKALRNADDALVAARMTPFEGDPGGFAPPAGAQAQSGFTQQAMGFHRQQRIYLCPGSVESAQAHYRGLLEAAGFRAFADKPAPDGTVGLTFVKPSAQANLFLRNSGAQGKMVRVVLIVTQQ